jgi:hypothetical protein
VDLAPAAPAAEPARAEPARATLIVAPDGGQIDGAHLLIHADPNADPTEWIPHLPRAPIRTDAPRFMPI